MSEDEEDEDSLSSSSGSSSDEEEEDFDAYLSNLYSNRQNNEEEEDDCPPCEPFSQIGKLEPIVNPDPGASAIQKTFKKKELPPNFSYIRDLPPQGLGPWYVFVLVNVGSEEQKKQAEVRLHTSFELIKAIKNHVDQGDWAIVMKMGPFYDLDLGYLVLSQWADETRGPQPRIAQGLCLWQRYKHYGIGLWALDQDKKAVQEAFRETRRLERAAQFSVLGMTDSLTRSTTSRQHSGGDVSVREMLSAPSMFVVSSSVAKPPPPNNGKKRVSVPKRIPNGRKKKTPKIGH